jgi:hypothetical protein
MLKASNTTEVAGILQDHLENVDFEQAEADLRQDESTEFYADALSVFSEGLSNLGFFRKSSRDSGN